MLLRWAVTLVATITAVQFASPTVLVVAASGETGGNWCFVSHGCWGGANAATQRGVAELMGRVAARVDAKFVIAAGDNFYPRGVTSVSDSRFRTVFEDVYKAPSLASVPFLVALGNHDYRGDIWSQVNYTKQSSRWFLPHPYYERRFPEASVSVIVLDCPLLERCDANRGKERWAKRCWDHEQQHKWFAQTLSNAARDDVRNRVVVCHYPLYANGPHVNHQWLIDLIEPQMRQYGVHLYINADNHYMQVSIKDGVAFVNSGGGGGYNPHRRSDRGYAKNKFDAFEVMQMGVATHCVTPTGIDTAFYAVGGGDRAHIDAVYSFSTVSSAAAAALVTAAKEPRVFASSTTPPPDASHGPPQVAMDTSASGASQQWDTPSALLVISAFVPVMSIAYVLRRTSGGGLRGRLDAPLMTAGARREAP